MAKDIILHCIGDIGFDGATYRAMQFDGPGAIALAIDDRMTIANMAIEAGGKNGIFDFDARTAEYVDARTRLNGTKSTYEPVALRPRPEVRLRPGRSISTSSNRPSPAIPIPGQRKLAKELGHVKLDRAYIGSCTGGKTSDFLAFAACLRGKHGEDRHLRRAGDAGDRATICRTRAGTAQTVWDSPRNAGVQMTENAVCAACLGGPVDTFGRMNTARSSASARRTAISPAAWATRNRKSFSRRPTRSPPPRSPAGSPTRANSFEHAPPARPHRPSLRAGRLHRGLARIVQFADSRPRAGTGAGPGEEGERQA